MKIAIMGFGVVGSGVAEAFYSNIEKIGKHAGCEVDIKYILDTRDISNTPFGAKATKDFEKILKDSEVNLVVETIGGINPAYEFTKQCLLSGKHVVTSNKELVATNGCELLKIARENNVSYLFEAAVGGGIPLLHPLYQCLGWGEIQEVAGILNGTTNFIMTRMFQDKLSFEESLKLAQDNGFAERNPSSDIDGIDAARKIAIISSMIMNKYVDPQKIYTQGISKLTQSDIKAAEAVGYVVKLMAQAVKNGEKILSSVSPSLISKESPLANVFDVYNGALVKSYGLDDVIFIGKGAGKLPTAAAVITDIIDCAKANGNIKELYWDEPKENISMNYDDAKYKYMLRTSLLWENKIGVKFESITEYNDEKIYITQHTNNKTILELAENDSLVLSAIRILEY